MCLLVLYRRIHRTSQTFVHCSDIYHTLTFPDLKCKKFSACLLKTQAHDLQTALGEYVVQQRRNHQNLVISSFCIQRPTTFLMFIVLCYHCYFKPLLSLSTIFTFFRKKILTIYFNFQLEYIPLTVFMLILVRALSIFISLNNHFNFLTDFVSILFFNIR